MLKRKTYNNTSRFDSLTLRDHLDQLENVSERRYATKDDGKSYEARCPLHHNHPNGDRNPSLIISRGNKRNVVYFCMSQGGKKGKCSNDKLAHWFSNKFKEGRAL
jgi:hypothetical protein|tara:strand:- start:179 stop:493 length:315 start_codon:yes stop_codon:yes gene_type:complete